MSSTNALTDDRGGEPSQETPRGPDSRRPFEEGWSHVLTIDLEEYFHGPSFDGAVSSGDWDYLPGHVERCVDRWLEVLGARGVRATFFVLGWIADRHPEAVRRLAAAGHEIASRGWSPEPLEILSRDDLRERIRRTRARLQELCDQPVHGFRAPRPPPETMRDDLFDTLIEVGHVYDASLGCPPTRDPEARPVSMAPFTLERPEGRIVEVPTGATLLGALRIPAPSGAWLRHLPYAVTQRRLAARREARSWSLVQVRSWEIDPYQPRLPLPPIDRFRHYRNLDRFPGRVGQLLSEFHFVSLADRLGLDEWSAGEATGAGGEATGKDVTAELGAQAG